MKRYRNAMAFAAMIVLLLVLLVMNLCIGSSSVPVSDVWLALTGRATDATVANVVLQLRLPRALAAIVLGGALALSGYLLQTFFHNPIAGPFILGISSGAKLTVAIAMVFALSRSMVVNSATLMAASFVGAMAAMGLVLLLSTVVKRMSVLIIGGVMIGYLCSAVTEFIITFAADEQIARLHTWSVGSFSGIDMTDVLVMTIVVALTFVGVLMLSKPISAFRMGETYASSVGVNVKAFRALLVLLSSILAATVTAFAGPVSFVGVAVPHLVRSLLGSSEPRRVIPACFLGGAAFCLLCDLLARTMFAPTELSISTVTAVFGAPVVLWILVRRQKGRDAA
ncbi:MAG: iron ABC transporter permease [Acutalibacteraceae bacterium]|nr:iron ABC transporter permease [Acutalibacteraceae bacterium]MEE3312138.1 iron ABC transporter permease [Acutalibacteraceae bacterium]